MKESWLEFLVLWNKFEWFFFFNHFLFLSFYFCEDLKKKKEKEI